MNSKSAVIRIKWLHAKASADRFDEEVRLLKAESERVDKTFRHFEGQWRNLRRAYDKSGDRFMRGGYSLAGRHADEFSRLAEEAERSYMLLMAWQIS